ncbi:MAG TPA: hypothetical protein PLY90_00340 [Candidatus Hydrogenedentes bacterium]|nr:hypothetical protein [Candidatus Hydrogenedentota bacterium]HOM49071.1 hypothetical protein [Candidatus Hydrogenedentota bacterium]HOR50104.1 hypothetical protein [Candidatus Hydrogenedentota bacterium]HPK24199.1 hypothetical protein [Candidatus Hydrogenedentota bacterium]HPX85410.1 hypothetical protein [Candidatus Hydrogenedentota bacterium]
MKTHALFPVSPPERSRQSLIFSGFSGMLRTGQHVNYNAFRSDAHSPDGA